MNKRAQDKLKNQRAFLSALRQCGRIDVAAGAAGISRQCHYKWLKKDPDYLGRYEEAHSEAVQMLEDEATRRAVEGVSEDIYYQGEVVGTKLNYSDTLLIFLLKAAKPEKYRERYDVSAKVHSHNTSDQPPVVVALSKVLTLDQAKRVREELLVEAGKENGSSKPN